MASAAIRPHERRDGPHAQERAAQRHLVHTKPSLHRNRLHAKGRRLGPGRVVDQNVDLPEAARDLLHGVHRGRVDHIRERRQSVGDLAPNVAPRAGNNRGLAP